MTLLGTHLKRTGEQTIEGQRAGGVTVSLRIAECKPLASAPWLMTSDARMQSYQHLDYAELRDMENDSFVKNVISHNEGLHHGH